MKVGVETREIEKTELGSFVTIKDFLQLKKCWIGIVVGRMTCFLGFFFLLFLTNTYFRNFASNLQNFYKLLLTQNLIGFYSTC